MLKKQNISPIVLVIAFLVITLMLFSDKAFHVDDTLFLYAARHIAQNPLRPYDFTINWNGSVKSFWDINRNPPASSYILSFLIKIFSEREVPLHACYIIFPVICVAALYRLSRSFVKNAILACLFLSVTPAFFVSSTSLMCDIPQLAFFLSALMLYIHGFEKDRVSLFILSGIFAGLAMLTKYLAVSIIAVFFLYNTVFRKDYKKSWWAFVIPAVMMSLWALHGVYFYGKPHILTIFSGGYSLFWKEAFPLAALLLQLAEFLVFFSASLLITVFSDLAAAEKPRRRYLLSWLIIFSVSAVLAAVIGNAFGKIEGRFTLLAAFLFIVISLSFLRNCFLYVAEHLKDARFLFLFGWFLINSCVAVVNYGIAVRFILGVLPPAVLLVVYLAEAKDVFHGFLRRAGYLVCFAAFAVTLLVAYSDYRFADTNRNFSEFARRAFPVENIFFIGHWGFQYYMERNGFKALDFENGSIKRGDLIILPMSASGWYTKALAGLVKPYRQYLDEKSGVFSIMQPYKAGFYLHTFGPLPYAPGPRFVERYQIYEVETSHDGRFK